MTIKYDPSLLSIWWTMQFTNSSSRYNYR